MTTPDNAMIDPMPELDIDTAGHTGIRIRGYSVERVKALLDRIASLEAELISQTNRAAAAEQQVTDLTQRLDTANSLNTEARNQLAELTATYEAKFNGLQEAMNNLDTVSSGRTELNQRLAQLSARQAVPDGWRLVPVEPSEKMIKAGNTKTWVLPCNDCWSEMLSAAPPPPEREPLSADDLREPKNGKAWRVEWWNESLRMMLPSQMRLDRVQAFKTGTLVLTLKKSVNAHGIGATNETN
ncbi:hypothetical protein ACFIQF_13010 [Comamonas sp. J-3]|uniref:hypothetical protein n=1 Tax=Comamonas trifloxystrobinivorans TaxID=3350256 RepID=UPI003726BF65